MSPRWRLIIAATAFLGWLGYLSYAAATKSRAPVVSHAQAAAADAAVVVNATPVGMGDTARDVPVPVEVLHRGQVVADLVYHPLETALLAGARERGAAVVDGLGMLVHQAALQVERWTGEVAPVAVMRAAAAGALEPMH
jgi:shikimate dehydrogenase